MCVTNPDECNDREGGRICNLIKNKKCGPLHLRKTGTKKAKQSKGGIWKKANLEKRHMSQKNPSLGKGR